jgi:hypothetical protein
MTRLRGVLFTKLFWRDAVERVVVTAAQAALVVGSLDGVDQLADREVDLATLASAAGFGALYAFLKALVAGLYGDRDSASLDPRLETWLRP